MPAPTFIPAGDDALHTALCTGPFQFAFVLGIWNYLGIPVDHCTIFFYNHVENQTVMLGLRHLADKHGVTMRDNLTLEREGKACFDHLFAESVKQRVFWFSKAIAVSFPAYDLLPFVKPDVLVHFYESYHSAISQPKTRQLLAAPEGAILWVGRDAASAARAMEPGAHLVPEYQRHLWQRYADATTLAKTICYPSSHALDSLLDIGREIATLRKVTIPTLAPDAIILNTGLFSEYTPDIGRDHEMAFYRTVLETLARHARPGQICVKPHPRASMESEARLRTLSAELGCTLLHKELLLETVLTDSPGVDRTVIGPPSVSLVHSLTLGLARPVCFSSAMLVRALGEAYKAYPMGMKDISEGHHALVDMGITPVNSLLELEKAVFDQKPPAADR